MTNINELNEQIAKIDVLLQEAYAENNVADVVLFAGLIAKLTARKAEAESEHKPEPVRAWMNASEEKSARESALEARIMFLDEYSTMDF